MNNIKKNLLELFNSKKIFLYDKVLKKNITYNQFFLNSIKLSNFLKVEKNVKKNDVVLCKIEQSSLFYELIFACLILKCKLCPISNDWITEDQKKLKAEINPVLEIYSTTNLFYSTEIKVDIKEIISNLDLEYNFLLISSSGTTSNNLKIIQHSLKNFYENSLNFARLTNFKKNDMFYAFWPQSYMAGIFNLFFVPLFCGSSIVLYHQIKLANLLEIISKTRKYRISQLYLTPTMIFMMIRYKKIIFKNFKFSKKINIISTSSFLYPDIKENFLKLYKKNIRNCYGITELCGSISYEKKINTDFGSAGKLISEIDIKCEGTKQKPKKIFFKSKSVCKSYYNTNKSMKNKFFDSGDLGYVVNNELFILGRSGELIKKGGIFVSLNKIEEIALGIEGIISAAAICKKEKFSGAEIHLYIQPEKFDYRKNIKNKLLKKFNDSLNIIETPDKIVFVKKIATTVIGKVKKFYYN